MLPLLAPQVVKIQFSNSCIFWKKGKQRLANEAKYFLVRPCFKNKQNPAPPLVHSSLPQECIQRSSSFISVAESNCTWHCPYA